MDIWELSPTEYWLNSPDWRASDYVGVVHIRAESNIEARQIATDEYVSGDNFYGVDPPPCNPWTQQDLVTASILQNHLYSLYDDDPSEIVWDEDYEDEDDSYL